VKYKSRTEFVLSHVIRKESGKILDIGFIGEYNEPFIHNAILGHTNAHVVGIDISASIDSFKNNNHATYFKRSVYDIRKDALFVNSFDTVVMCEIIEHLKYPWQALENASIALREGGVLIITYPNPYALTKLINYLRASDIASSQFISNFLGSPDHLHFPTLPGLLRHASQLGLKPTEIAFMKGFGSNIPFLNRFSAYIGVALKKENHSEG